MMHRRAFVIALGTTVLPFASHAQKPPARMPRIGYLTARSIDLEKRWLHAFLQGLRELGYVEGKNIVIEQRHAAGRTEKLAEFAAELVRMKVDVLVAASHRPAIEAKKATQSIPIVSLTQDPVAFGLAASFARPGGNVTGVSDNHSEMGAKRLEMLKEIAPEATRTPCFAKRQSLSTLRG